MDESGVVEKPLACCLKDWGSLTYETKGYQDEEGINLVVYFPFQ